jgi:hypothetical protein
MECSRPEASAGHQSFAEAEKSASLDEQAPPEHPKAKICFNAAKDASVIFVF